MLCTVFQSTIVVSISELPEVPYKNSYYIFFFYHKLLLERDMRYHTMEEWYTVEHKITKEEVVNEKEHYLSITCTLKLILKVFAIIEQIFPSELPGIQIQKWITTHCMIFVT